MRVACFSPYPEAGPSVRHRILAYREHWGRAGIALTFWPFMSSRFYAIRRSFTALAFVEKAAHFAVSTMVLALRVLRVRRFDAVIIHREAFPLGGALFERAIRGLNPNVIYDFDDAIWRAPSSPVDQRRRFRVASRVPEIIRASPVVVVGNEFLAEYARQFNSRVQVIPTTYGDLGEPPPRREEGRAPVVIWIGNWGNTDYLYPVLDILEEVCATDPFRLRLVGGADISEVRSARLPIEYLTWREDHESEWLRSADIGIMPLHDQEYERGKCAFKLIQYFSAGLPVIASPVGMNKDVVRHGENGFLAASRGEWAERLRTLLRDRGLRERMGRSGRRFFLAEFSRERSAERWKDILLSVAGGRASA